MGWKLMLPTWIIIKQLRFINEAILVFARSWMSFYFLGDFIVFARLCFSLGNPNLNLGTY